MSVSRLPIRWRLTIWYASLLAAALLLFGVALYVGLRVVLYDTFNEQVRNRAALARSTVQVEGGQLTLDPATIANFSDDEHFVRMLRADGQVVVDTSAAAGPVPIDPALLAAATAGQSLLTTHDTPNGTLVIATEPVRDNGAVVGILQTAASRNDVEDTVRIIVLVLAVAAPIVLVVASGGGYVLAGRALRPVAEITRRASTIGANDLHARLDLPLPDDELGRLARTFDAMLARIEEAFERQRRFTGDAAHELRTPLSLMRGQVDLALARDRSADDYRDALHELDADLERLTGLVGTLLALARSDAGAMTPDRAPIDLAATVAAVADLYEPLAADAGVALATEAAATPADADEDLIIQILVNLVDNALAHTPDGGRITIGCAPDGGGARLWVSDTGRGIPTEHQARVFDRFYRVDAARTTGGSGLGLAICRTIAEAHGGAITLTCEPGAGARFDVSLPKGQPSRPARL